MSVSEAGEFPKGVRFSEKLQRTWAYRPPGSRTSQVLRYLGRTNEVSRQRMNALIAHVDEYGFHQSETRYRSVGGGLVELKVGKPRAIRILVYRLPQGGHVLLLGFDKIEETIPSDVMNRAQTMAREFEKGGAQLE